MRSTNFPRKKSFMPLISFPRSWIWGRKIPRSTGREPAEVFCQRWWSDLHCDDYLRAFWALN
jgi:hypothetical protein